MKLQPVRPRWAARLLLCVGLARPAWATDGVEPIGISTQSLIRGGADVAIGDSALSQVENPATLLLVPGSVDASGEFLFPSTHWRSLTDSAGSSVHCIPLGHIGIALPQNDNWSLGVAVWSKSQLGTHFRLRTPSYLLTSRETHADMRDFGIGLNTAFRITDKLSLGAGLRLEPITGEFTSLAGPEQIHFGRGWGLGAGYQLGLHYRITPRLTFGAGYRSPTWYQDLLGSHNSSRFTNEWEIRSPTAFPVRLGRALIDDLELPQKVLAGFGWDVSDRLRLNVEGRWINYSNSSLHKAKYDVDLTTRAQLNSVIGYRDQYAVMTGAEYKLTDRWTVGGGYHFATNPIADRAFLPIADMIVEHHLTTGLTYRTDKWWLGGGYILGLPNTLSAAHRTSILFGLDSISGDVRQVQQSLFVGGGYRW